MRSMARRRRRRAELPLPWERGVGGLREVVFGRRTLPAAGLVLLAGGLFGLYRLGVRSTDHDTTLASIDEVQRAARAFVVDMNRCPRSPSELVHPPKTGVHYLERVPRDAWNQDLYFECHLDGQPVVTVTSAGPSGSLLVDDNLP